MKGRGWRIFGSVLSAASSVAGGAAAITLFVPGLHEFAPMLQGTSIGLGVAAAGSYALGGDAADAEASLAGAGLGVMVGGLGSGGAALGEKLVTRCAPALTPELLQDGAGAFIDESGKQAVRYSGRSFAAILDRSGKSAKTMATVTSMMPGTGTMMGPSANLKDPMYG